MPGFFVILKISCCCGSIVTLITWISDTLMLGFFVLFKITCCCGSIFTLVTWVSDTLVLGYFMLSQNMPPCCCVIAAVTLKFSFLGRRILTGIELNWVKYDFYLMFGFSWKTYGNPTFAQELQWPCDSFILILCYYAWFMISCECD